MARGPEILEMVRKFTASRVLLTAAELDLFSEIECGCSTSAALAEKCRVDLRALTRILDCLVVLGVLEKDREVYRVTGDGALLSSKHPESVLPMALHMNHMWRNWSHLTEAVRVGTNPHRANATDQAETLGAFIGAMHVVGRETSRRVAAAYDASRFERLLDVGGGSGTYTQAFLERYPTLRAMIFDLPGVIPLARERLGRAGLLDRVDFVAGDFYADDLPAGCDLVLLSAIIHQNGPRQNVDLYRKIHRTLVPGGRILIRDHVMDEERIHPPGGALFALNMLVGTEAGDTYTFDEVRETLEEAGFRDVRLARQGDDMDALVEAVKPA